MQTIKVTASQTYIRQSPRKLRLVANQIKSLPFTQALRQLAVIERRATLVLLKVLKQGAANAKHNFGLSPVDLDIAELTVTGGPRYKRFRAVSRGRSHGIIKTTSHVKLILATRPTDDHSPTPSSSEREPQLKLADQSLPKTTQSGQGKLTTKPISRLKTAQITKPAGPPATPPPRALTFPEMIGSKVRQVSKASATNPISRVTRKAPQKAK